jgi:dihydroorotase
MSERILITGAHLLDPANAIDSKGTLAIADGKIVSLGSAPADFTPDWTLDATGLTLIPGIIDLNARLREPGPELKGTIISETRAAARGGITTVICPPDTNPPIDTPAVAELIRRRAKISATSRVLSTGAMTIGLQGNHLTEMAALISGGCIAISNGRAPFATNLVLRRAMEYAATWNIPLFLQPLDHSLANGGVAHEGRVAARLGLPGIPAVAEQVMVQTILELARLTGARVHFQQISTAAAVSMIAAAQSEHLPVTADVAAHQLHLTEMDLDHFNANCHLLPPLRSEADRDGLRAGVASGVIGAICSAHEPHEPDAKKAPFPSTAPGLSGLETLLPLTLKLVQEKVLPLSRALSLLTTGPASIARLSTGCLREGEDADLCLFDADKLWTFDTAQMISKGQNSPFHNWRFQGEVCYTFFEGRLTYQAKN